MLDPFPGHVDWNIQTQRLIAQSSYGGADAFEIDQAATRIIGGDMDSWYREWFSLGKQIHDLGRASENNGDTITAGKRLLRASNYYRHADFFLPGRDPRKRETYLLVSDCFKRGHTLLNLGVENIQVKCGNDVYDGYFCPAFGTKGPGPAVLMLGGADSLAEELFFWGLSELRERGISVMLLDTPGRGSSLRLKNIYSRPDYEVPVRAAIDYLCARPEVDKDRVGCVGVSMAGYYAPRGAAFEPRIKALVLWCACYDILKDLYEWYPAIRGQIQWILGVENDAQARERLKDFNLGGIAKNITCPTLISHGVDDVVMNVEGAKRLHQEISSKEKVLKVWGGAEGGAVHCNYDNWALSIPFMFDWLAKRL
ncbi:MAG: alpha/beta hydrolase [Xanthobacteraceae bacterium]|nr:alpha/beta hydrolase [Xanthobacteraceae bacterium]